MLTREDVWKLVKQFLREREAKELAERPLPLPPDSHPYDSVKAAETARKWERETREKRFLDDPWQG